MPSVRAFWINAALLMVKPVLHSICNEKFKQDFPSTELRNSGTDRNTHLEALARSLQGVAPWLELQEDPEAVALAPIARCAIALATDPNSTQYMAFTRGSQVEDAHQRQPLVDAAILAHAMLRAPRQLWGKLERGVKRNVIAALHLTRGIKPYMNNWQLFASIIEAFMYSHGEQVQEDRLLTGLRLHKEWYLGDGWWGDGPEFAHNFYNSYVIQPMLYDILTALHHRQGVESTPQFFIQEGLGELETLVSEGMSRWSSLLESFVHPDGSYPVIGRSVVYRCGAFHVLSLAALKHLLPSHVLPGQARTALTRAINRTLDASVTYDRNGWLTIGLIGSQPHLAQFYSSQGSMYQAAAVFLPLGLAASDPFWTDPQMPTTWEKLWRGEQAAS
ncbi:hypothetical protein PLESTB_001408600 [Pleodorina starrii]|uniref:DUF2264 domain-containing protein n=1 Tax=Pleodorina starrii TaxID=330485 RepID=A0A9W6F765_9CHLO|nr:hypothetical protein PLESTB_001408600 [Pleodorina starrii]GLC68038.1 hypothetical protein PLESTF_000638200 [Pleodorina starrii]